MMFKIALIFYTIIFLIPVVGIRVFAQTEDSLNTDKPYQPLWILTLPGTISESKEQAVENEVCDIVTDIAWRLGHFEIFDRYDVWDLLQDSPLDTSGNLPDSTILSIGDSVYCDEAIIVDILEFSQMEVPLSDGKDSNFFISIFKGLSSRDSSDFSDNIETQLSVQFRILDLTNGSELDHDAINVSHTGGDLLKSQKETLDKFREAMYMELRKIYQLESEVITIAGLGVDLSIGADRGITKNTLFKITEPDSIEIIGNSEVIKAGTDVGLASVQNVGDSVNHSLLVRQWQAIEPGFQASEYNKKIHVIQLYFLPELFGTYMFIGGQYHHTPLESWDYGGSVRYSTVTDSYKGKDHGLGFGVFGSRRIWVFTALNFYVKLGIDLDIFFKEDDDGRVASTGVFSGVLGISSNFMLSKKSDLAITVGYRLSQKQSKWTYTDNDDYYDAFWPDEAPVIDLSGFYFTLGYKYFLF